MKDEKHETFEQWVYRIRNQRKELVKNGVVSVVAGLLLVGLVAIAIGTVWWVWSAAGQAHPGARLLMSGICVAIAFGILLGFLTESW